ncbi:MAG TPA: DUF3987 domain-containing protein [Sedimentisphaerales bacterium]|nr:DUF3987 domain-containing protein [Sedimentisphaerales bacterium]
MAKSLPKLTRNQIRNLEAKFSGALSKGVPSKLHAPPMHGKPQSLTPIEKVLRALDVHGCEYKEKGPGEWMAQCPAHDDQKPSLSIKEVPGKVLLRCFAQCSVQAVVRALDIQMSDLFEEPGIAALYDYQDENGNLLFQIVRRDPKDFRPRHLGADGKWENGVKGVRRVLYNLPRLRRVPPHGMVFVCEGEKDADRLTALGLTATTCPFGAGKWLPEYSQSLRNRSMAILPDNDEPGEKHATQVAGALKGIAWEVKVVRLPGLPEKGDVSDWLDNGGSKDELLRLVKEAELWQEAVVAPHEPPPILLYKDFPLEVIPAPVQKYIRMVAKIIDCDPSYVAVPLLTALASAIGNTRKIRLNDLWSEPPILWTVIIGQSGTAKSPALELALRPLMEMENEILRQFKEDLKEYEAAKREFERECKQKKPKDSKPPTEPVRPVANRLAASDTTVEALARLLSESPKGIIVVRDELAGWLESFNAYKGGKGGDAATWLQLHRAGTIIKDRVGDDGVPIHVHPASVCITGSIQPDVLQRVLPSEYISNGLAGRILFAMPPTRAKRYNKTSTDPALNREMRRIFEDLRKLSFEVDAKGLPGPKEIRLTEAAEVIWGHFVDNRGDETVSFDDPALAAAWSKLEAYAARFALVLHMVKVIATPGGSAFEDLIDVDGIRAGIKLAEWFGHEAMRVYARRSEDDERAEDRNLLEYIQQPPRKKDGKEDDPNVGNGRMTVRGLQRGPQRFRNSSEEAKAALQKLVDAGYGHWEHTQPEPQGGRPAEVFVLTAIGDGDRTGS